MRSKCPYCKGVNLYLRRSWPVEKYGCKDCERRVKIMQDAGMSKEEIKQVIAG